MKSTAFALFALAACEAPRAPAASVAPVPARDDVLLADFEGDDYGAWSIEGDAFGRAPARGTFANQQKVTGFEGRGLVDTYLPGDASVGTLTSPEFAIERPRIEFLIGGGRHGTGAEYDALELLIDGEVVRSATGDDDEHLERDAFDVAEFVGRRARLRIVDRATGGWGHINVDSIALTDRVRTHPAKRELAIDHRYLWLPIQNGAPMRTVTLATLDGEPYTFTVELANERTDWTAFVDLERERGKHVVATSSRGANLESLHFDDSLPSERELYREALRPQFHFTSRRGWLNDPNGLVFADGEWHLFYQHNPFGHEWGNMHWGHAVSADLVHWKELADALRPDREGGIWSGSGAVDVGNTSKLGPSGSSPLVLLYAHWSSPPAECLAWSVDRGRSFTKFASNPVIPSLSSDNRDPRVFWYEPTKHWVLVHYISGSEFAIHVSSDLLHWRETSRVTIQDSSECPDLFPLAVAGESAPKWILLGGNGHYLIGEFDGERFTRESGPFVLDFGSSFYASQTFNDAPEGRRVQIGWMNGATPFASMPFNCQMSFPCELALWHSPDGLRITRNPVRELANLVHERVVVKEDGLQNGSRSIGGVSGGLYDVDLQLNYGASGEVGAVVNGQTIAIDCAKRELVFGGRRTPLPDLTQRTPSILGPRTVELRILADRASIEVFFGGGVVATTSYVAPNPADVGISLFAHDATLYFSGEVRQLASSWR